MHSPAVDNDKAGPVSREKSNIKVDRAGTSDDFPRHRVIDREDKGDTHAQIYPVVPQPQGHIIMLPEANAVEQQHQTSVSGTARYEQTQHLTQGQESVGDTGRCMCCGAEAELDDSDMGNSMSDTKWTNTAPTKRDP